MPKLKRAAPDQEFLGRLKETIAEADSIASLARSIERTEGSIRNWIEGRSQPNGSDIICLCRELGIRADWLLLGEEPKYSRDSKPGSYEVVEEKYLSSVVMVEEQAELLCMQMTALEKGQAMMDVYLTMLREPSKVTPKFVAATMHSYVEK